MKLSGIKLNVFKANMRRWFYRGAWTVVFGLLAVAVVAGALTLFVVMLVVGSIGLLAVSLGAWLTRRRLRRTRGRNQGADETGRLIEGEYSVDPEARPKA